MQQESARAGAGRGRVNTVGWLAVIVLCLGALPAAAAVSQKMLLGWVEHVAIAGVPVKGKLDTGAKTSSLDAREIRFFERDDRDWVRFSFQTRDPRNPEVVLERPVVRFVRIKRHVRKHQRRAVVEMNVCIGGRQLTAEFSLINRDRFLYPVLLGRRALKDIVLVDPGATFLGGEACRNGGDKGNMNGTEGRVP